MANATVDGLRNSGILQLIVGFGGMLFGFFRTIGVVRTGGIVDSFDD